MQNIDFFVLAMWEATLAIRRHTELKTHPLLFSNVALLCAYFLHCWWALAATEAAMKLFAVIHPAFFHWGLLMLSNFSPPGCHLMHKTDVHLGLCYTVLQLNLLITA